MTEEIIGQQYVGNSSDSREFTLGDVACGEALKDINAKIAMAAVDIVQREQVEKKREIKITIELVPNGKTMSINVFSELKLPKDMGYKDVCMRPKEDGKLLKIQASTSGANESGQLPLKMGEY